MTGQGSGFFISADGFAVTNNHVVEGGRKFTVDLTDGRLFDAVLVGADKATDIAVLRIEPDGRPLDLTFATLRSVSPIHLQYLKNMGVRASASVSIVIDDALWGLIACHHQTPLVVPPEVRTVFTRAAIAAFAGFAVMGTFTGVTPSLRLRNGTPSAARWAITSGSAQSVIRHRSPEPTPALTRCSPSSRTISRPSSSA